MFERNDEYSADKDSIVSDDGVADAASNNGYILGLPFVRAFMVYLDFEKNTVGLASKLNNYGAIITSQKETNAPATPNAPAGSVTPGQPVDPDHPEV